MTLTFGDFWFLVILDCWWLLTFGDFWLWSLLTFFDFNDWWRIFILAHLFTNVGCFALSSTDSCWNSCCLPLHWYYLLFVAILKYLSQGSETNGSRSCLSSGEWDWSESPEHAQCDIQKLPIEDISVIIYTIGRSILGSFPYSSYDSGYSISLSALCGALLVYLLSRYNFWFDDFCFIILSPESFAVYVIRFTSVSFLQLHWPIHSGFSSPFFRLKWYDLDHFITWSLQSLIQDVDSIKITNFWCICHVLLRYFHLTTFFWMFLEGKKTNSILCRVAVFIYLGFYLLLQVQLPLSLATFRLCHFLLFGWGRTYF